MSVGPLRRRLARSRLLGIRIATALAALVLCAGLVIRMSAPLSSSSPTARQTITTNGVLDLAADREAPLFDGVMLAPGTPVSACARVDVDSPDDPYPVTLALHGYEGSPALADATQVVVEYAYEEPADCASLVPERTTATGSLADLVRESAGGRSPWRTGDPLPGSSALWFRLTLLLPEDAAPDVAGHVVDRVDVVWASSVPAPAEGDLRERALLVAAGVAEHAVMPLLMMLVLALLFLGVQSRIDGRDPKLAAAPVVHGSLEFPPPTP